MIDEMIAYLEDIRILACTSSLQLSKKWIDS